MTGIPVVGTYSTDKHTQSITYHITGNINVTGNLYTYTDYAMPKQHKTSRAVKSCLIT